MTGPVRAVQANLVACYVLATKLEASRLAAETDADARLHALRVAEVLSDAATQLSAMADEPGRGRSNGGDIGPSEDGSLSTGRFVIALDEASERHASPDDMAFVAAIQLNAKLALLRRLLASAAGAATLMEAAASGARHVMRAMASVEPAYASSFGLAARLDSRVLLDRAVNVRRAYAAFRRAVSEASDLGGVVAAIEELRRSPVHRDLRPSDHDELERLFLRLGRAATGTRDADEGLADARAFAEMLVGVNARQELIEHDLRVLPVVIAHLEMLVTDGRAVLRGHLEKVRGMDDAVEALLSPGLPIDGARILQELRRVECERRRFARMSSEPGRGPGADSASGVDAHPARSA